MIQESYLSNNPQHLLRRAGEEMHQAGGGGCEGGQIVDGGVADDGEIRSSEPTKARLRLTVNEEGAMVMQKVVLTLILAVGIAGCAAQHSGNTAESEGSAIAQASDFITIALDKPAYFTAADGETLLAPAGQYMVEPVDESHLRLTSEHSTAPLVITAALQTHDNDIPVPLVLAFSEKEDEPHVVLLLPGGHALDAVGSFTGIQSRNVIRTNRRYSLQAQAEKVGTSQLGTSAQFSTSAAVVSAIPPIGPVIAAAISTIAATQRAVKEQQHRGPKNLESQNKLDGFALQTLMSDYNQADTLASSVLAKMLDGFRLELNVDRPGSDYTRRFETTPESCRMVCVREANCQAFTFMRPPAGSPAGQCFLKRTVPAAITNPCCISGMKGGGIHTSKF